MEQDIQEILFSQEALARRVKELAGEIRRDYAGKAPLVVGVLRGCFVFMADLVRELDFPLTLDFMAASSYHGTESSGKVNIQLTSTTISPAGTCCLWRTFWTPATPSPNWWRN